MSQKLHKKAQLWLDVGGGGNPQEGCMVMDKRKLDGVDVIHDWHEIPWPFADETFTRILLIHVVEHFFPWKTFDIFNELWRIMKPKGVVMIVTPYAGSVGFHQDPTHIHGWVEQTPLYFTPVHDLYKVYEPKPWKIEANSWNSTGTLEVVMRKLS